MALDVVSSMKTVINSIVIKIFELQTTLDVSHNKNC